MQAMECRFGAFGILREVASLFVVAAEVHREEVVDLYSLQEQLGASGEVAALPYIDREHGYVDLLVFRRYAVENLLE